MTKKGIMNQIGGVRGEDGEETDEPDSKRPNKTQGRES
jgi:hypothetical protein